MNMAKTEAQYEAQRKQWNKYQKEYRARNRELCEIWKQRTYANHLRRHGWTVTEPEGMMTPAEAREKRDFINSLPDPEYDLSDLPYF